MPGQPVAAIASYRVGVAAWLVEELLLLATSPLISLSNEFLKREKKSHEGYNHGISMRLECSVLG